ncbi:AzlD domain-containing protein [Tissierella sp. Yu-01]|uniref:AzlD domain-containing protein n=1 Tax=Tissierella sp. Yu-01 TaxID=3035694 RepID=UPI00240E4F76|nr:AzlD domain-containing protein [Tissierella sp. Yu-01]WFA08453.1 AzlD domain-containing protein [Tissierella sp. Yu-01]
MKSYLPLIIGMGLVTYIPRLAPLLFLTNKELNPKLKQFLQFIPYTSLSILIVRGVLTSTSDMLLPTFVGIALAGIVAYFKSNLVLSVLVAIAASFVVINI